MNVPNNIVQFFRRNLLRWFDQFGRHDLPWQQNKTPYRVWLSEIMLQQTQVSTVIPYFNKFIAAYPTVQQLAQAELDDVLTFWAGLGYYRRARYLHQCANMVVENFQGEFPNQLDEMMSLPGIGKSSAGAILSLGMNIRASILDGNVKRVLARFFAITEPINENSSMKSLWALAEQLTPKKRFADFNQAMMDLGATCCTRSNPLCDQCALAKHCKAYQMKDPTAFPVRTSSKKPKPKRSSNMLIMINEASEICLYQREMDGIWPGLYAFPEVDDLATLADEVKRSYGLQIQQHDLMDRFTHQFTHFTLAIQPVICKTAVSANHIFQQNNYKWIALADVKALALPAPVQRIIKKLTSHALLKEENYV